MSKNISRAKTTINYICIHDRCLVLPDPVETKTAGGIIIPDTVAPDKHRGIVVSIGAGFEGKPLTIELGDHVSYSKFAGTDEVVEGITYKTMRETDIFGLIPVKTVVKIEPAADAESKPVSVKYKDVEKRWDDASIPTCKKILLYLAVPDSQLQCSGMEFDELPQDLQRQIYDYYQEIDNA